MTAAQTIARLDAALAREGEPVTLKRGATSVTVTGLVRGVKPTEIVGTVAVTHWSVVISPTALGALGIPKITDKATIKGKERQVLMADPIHIGATLVRVNLVVAG